MRAGIIGVPVDGEIDQIESNDATREEFGMEFHTTLDVQRVENLSGETKYVEGTALKEEQEKGKRAEVQQKDDDDPDEFSIRVRDARRKAQTWADFVAVEARNGHPGFVAVSTSDAEFVFDVVAKQLPGVRIDRTEIRLGSFVESKDSYNLQGAGGVALGSNADKFMTWGAELEDDDDLGDLVDANKESDTTPIAPGLYPYDGWTVHCNVAQSGWVEIWDPEFSTSQFVEWVESEVMPHVAAEEDDA